MQPCTSTTKPQISIEKKSQSPIKIYGEILQQLPKNLYIPPQALLVYLNHFEGPLDLLLYLIRSQGLSILDIPMMKITEQYLSYIQIVRQENFELVAEYMAMAATLIDIKTRMLLPKPPAENTEENDIDPRIDLAQRLLIYEAHKKAAYALNQLPHAGFDFWAIGITVELPDKPMPKMPSLYDIAKAWQIIHQRIALQKSHTVHKTKFSVREFIERINLFFQQFLPEEDDNRDDHQIQNAFIDIIIWQIQEHEKQHPPTELECLEQTDHDSKNFNTHTDTDIIAKSQPLQTFIVYSLIAILELAKLGLIKFDTLSKIVWLRDALISDVHVYANNPTDADDEFMKTLV